MKHTAHAHWEGSLKEGKGTLTTQSGALKNINSGLKARFEEDEIGTDPEELLAATHAGCYTMAVCSLLTRRGLDPATLDTEATVTMENSGITAMNLFIKGLVKDISPEEFVAIAKEAERDCMISKILRIPINTEARLVA